MGTPSPAHLSEDRILPLAGDPPHVIPSGCTFWGVEPAAFLAEQNKAGMETGDELEAPFVTAAPVGFLWTRLSGSG